MRTTTLEAICRVTSGGTPSRGNPEYSGGGIPWVKSGEVDQPLVLTTEETISEAGLRASAAQIIPAGAVLIAMYGATAGAVGALGINATTNQAVAAVVPLDPESTDSKYLRYFLQSRSSAMKASARGGAQPNLNLAMLRELRIPLPPIEEQRRIAAILDKADQIQMKRRTVLQIVQRLSDSVFMDMFSVGLFPSKSLRSLGMEFRYGTSAKNGQSGAPCLRIPNVAHGRIDTTVLKFVELEGPELSRLELNDGDLLFVRSNGNPDYIGRSAVFRTDDPMLSGVGPWVFASYLIRGRLPGHAVTRPAFVQAFLASPSGARQVLGHASTTAGQYNINTEKLGELRIPTPPLELQLEFERRIAAISSSGAVISRTLSSTESLFASLQQEAFRNR